MTKDKAEANGVIHNLIANGTKIIGTITAENDFRIDGSIDGEVTCEGKVVIGHKGRMEGHLTCRNAEIVGQMNGRLDIHEVLVLKSTAVVTGDIQISTLVVEPNAQFNGNCTMLKADLYQEETAKSE